MPTIEITFDRDGATTIETRGFQGKTCKDASKFLESLGKVLEDKRTPEYFQQGVTKVQQRNR